MMIDDDMPSFIHGLFRVTPSRSDRWELPNRVVVCGGQCDHLSDERIFPYGHWIEIDGKVVSDLPLSIDEAEALAESLSEGMAQRSEEDEE